MAPKVVKTFVMTRCFKGFCHRELLENFSLGVRSESCIETFLMSTRQTHFKNIHKLPAMDLVHHHNRGLLHFPTSSHMEMFSEVEWKKLNATTQELVCNCRSESVLRSVNERWISDLYGVRFGSTSSQNVCDDQMLQRILS